MNTFRKNSRFLIIIVVLLAGQIVFAQDSETPQWVLDRQQYDPTFVPVPQTESLVVVSQTPQWVLDRQQYDPTFVPVPQTESLVVVSQTPQWILDRQQYDPTFVPSEGDFPTTTVVLHSNAS